MWYQTWVFVVNLEIKGDFREGLLRTLLELLMTVERMECTDWGELDAVTKCMLKVRNEIPWLEDREARNADPNGCLYFGKRLKLKGISDGTLL